MPVNATHWSDFYHGDAPLTLTIAACFKAGEGLAYTDPSYLDFVAQAARGGHHSMAYYALHSGGTAAAIAQAKRAAGLIGKRPAMFDVENWPKESGSPAGIASLAEATAAVDAYRGSGGIMHVMYLPRSQWERMGSPDLSPLARRGLHIVNANYSNGVAPSSPAWAPYGGVKPWALQYQACHNVALCTWVEAWQVWTGTSSPSSSPAVPRVRTYPVVTGDTMETIAKSHGVSLAELEALNPHAGHPAGDFDVIYPGDHIAIPA